MLKNIRKGLISGGVRNSAVALQPCPSGHITADIRLRSAQIRQSRTSHVRKPLAEMAAQTLEE